MRVRAISKFTVAVYKVVSPLLLQTLQECHISDYIFQQGKGVALSDSKSFFGTPWVENSLDTYHFYCAPDEAAALFETIAGKVLWHQEGRGSVFVEPAILLEADETPDNFNELDLDFSVQKTALMGIYAIIQRGRGMALARRAVDSGSGVPALYYGTGGGIRDRMGLVRITIPPEKEMVNVVVAEHDAEGMMELLIEAGRLYRPGMGFIFTYPVSRADMDTKSFFGASRAAASVGQIVSAIDEIKGNTEWRRRTLLGQSQEGRTYMKNLENIMIICNDTMAKDLLHVAMNAGATGATISNCRLVNMESDGSQSKKSVEISDMVIGASQKRPIISALIEAGLFTNQMNGRIIVKKSCAAYTYIEKRK